MPRDASRCSASRHGTRAPGPRHSHPPHRRPTCRSPAFGSRCRGATPRRRRRSRCARCGPGTPPARSRASRSGARGCARRSRRSEGRRWSPSAFLLVVAVGVHHPAPPASTRRARTRRRDATARSRPPAKCHTTPRTPRKPELSATAPRPTDRRSTPRVTTERPVLLLKCSVSQNVVELLDEREEPRPQPDPSRPCSSSGSPASRTSERGMPSETWPSSSAAIGRPCSSEPRPRNGPSEQESLIPVVVTRSELSRRYSVSTRR